MLATVTRQNMIWHGAMSRPGDGIGSKLTGLGLPPTDPCYDPGYYWSGWPNWMQSALGYPRWMDSDTEEACMRSKVTPPKPGSTPIAPPCALTPPYNCSGPETIPNYGSGEGGWNPFEHVETGSHGGKYGGSTTWMLYAGLAVAGLVWAANKAR